MDALIASFPILMVVVVLSMLLFFRLTGNTDVDM